MTTIFDSKAFTWLAAVLIALTLSLSYTLDLTSDEQVEVATAAAVRDLADSEIYPTPQRVFDTYASISRERK